MPYVQCATKQETSSVRRRRFAMCLLIVCSEHPRSLAMVLRLCPRTPPWWLQSQVLALMRHADSRGVSPRAPGCTLRDPRVAADAARAGADRGLGAGAPGCRSSRTRPRGVEGAVG